MAKLQTIRNRGFFGWLFLILFLAFNAYIAATLIYGIWQRWSIGFSGTETIAFGSIIIMWCIGSVILGLLAILTRGSKSITTEID